MVKIINKEVIDLTPEQIAKMDWFLDNPPKIYVKFFKLYKKIIGPAIFLLLISVIIMTIIHIYSPLDMFNAIKYVLFGATGFALISLGFHIYKYFYTRRYAREKLGWNMKMWNKCTMGLSWDI